MIRHPQYPQYYIYEGYRGDRPKPNAFYAPKKGEVLALIAAKAYSKLTWSHIQRINRNPYNLQNSVYRVKSTDCRSRKATFEEVLQMRAYESKHQGWIALCPRDRGDVARKIGAPLPVIWIPSEVGQTPKAKAPTINPGKIIQPILLGDQEDTPQIRTDLLGGGGTGGGTAQTDVEQQSLPAEGIEPEKAMMGPWVVGAVIAAGIGALWWSTR